MHVTADQLCGALKAEGLRLTTARRAICEVLARSHDDHLTAAQIRNAAARHSRAGIDESTIYRTIDTLERLGFLHHAHFGPGAGVVHLSDRTDHHHLTCERCGRTVDLPLPEVSRFLDRLTTRHRFQRGSLHLALVGICESCSVNSR